MPSPILSRPGAQHRKTGTSLGEKDVRCALVELEPMLAELLPAGQARIIELLFERVDNCPTGIDLRLRVDGLTSLAGTSATPHTRSKKVHDRSGKPHRRQISRSDAQPRRPDDRQVEELLANF